MKKVFSILICLIIAISTLASCSRGDMSGGGSYSTGASDSSYYVGEPSGSGSTWSRESSQGGGDGSSGGGSATADEAVTSYSAASRNEMGSGVVPITAPDVGSGLAEKIIYTVSADIETLNFEETIEGVYTLLAGNSAFIEKSDVRGRNYEQMKRGQQSFRSASFTLRVPKDRLNAVTAGLDRLGNVLSLRTGAENITAQFSDTQSRLNSLKTQEGRLLDMLGKSETIEDMLEIEERLANIRYNIESLTSSLQNWQNQVDYSTLTIYISEVEVYTEPIPEPEPEPEPEPTYWEQVWTGLKESAIGVARFFMALFMWVIVNLPVLAILAVIAVAALIIVRRKLRKLRKRDMDSSNTGDSN